MKLTGIIPALITPLTETEDINVPVLHQLLEGLLAEGADGFYVGGATGEGISLRREVRETLTVETVKTVAHRKPCVIHIASTDYSEAIALARHAEACGADGISAIPPLFYPYDEDEVFAYYRGLAESVGIPLLVYFNPAAGFSMTADFAARLFTIDNVTAIKWTSSDYYGLIRLRDLTKGEMNIVNGPDEMLLMGLAAGADAAIGTTYNIQLPTVKKIYQAFHTGDMKTAQEAQVQADRVVHALLATKHLIPATKAVLEGQGYEVGNAAYPMKRLSAEEKRAICDEVFAIGCGK